LRLESKEKISMSVMNVQPNNFAQVNSLQRQSNSSSFGSVLQQYLQETDQAVKESENQSILLAKGEAVNLHDVTIAAQKANLALDLTVQIRDKAVEAYQEMMKLQV
jgi:flagellar hook-basal body complex protein FliE